MKLLVYFGLLLCSGILVVVACAAPGAAPAQSPQTGGQQPPIVTITPTPEPPPEYLISRDLNQQPITYTVTSASTYDEAARRSGCSSPFLFDGEEAYDRYPEEHWLLWTFSVNFDSFSKEKEGGPLGCLRLYQRNDDRDTFDLIQNGNILVDTCKVKPGVTFDSGSAIFDGAGYIGCSMNLSDWVAKLSSPLGLELTRTVDSQTIIVSDTFTSTHIYENFTIAAAIVPTETMKDTLLPLVSYSPQDSSKAKPALVLKSFANHIELSVRDCELVGDVSIQKSWWYGNQVWWYDLRQDSANENPYLLYSLNFLHEPADYQRYIRWCLIDNQSPLEFSLFEATLYIGFTPGITETFKGKIDAILIDPTDSKPEKL